jgi:protein tyrosine phosphatase (PTP) superfamily phosphohydrolase (DUF442 family)
MPDHSPHPIFRTPYLLPLAALLALAAAAGCPAAEAPAKPAAGRAWAKKIEKPGLPNLHQAAPGLYRGAQPTAEGMRELEKMGVKTVIDLRMLHSDRDEIGRAKLAYVQIPMTTLCPSEDDMVRFLRIVGDKNRGPVFVHCQHGADRTGTMCAVYRLAVCGWTKQEAVREMTQGGFGFHPIWQNLVWYVEALDVEAVKKKVGRPGPK